MDVKRKRYPDWTFRNGMVIGTVVGYSVGIPETGLFRLQRTALFSIGFLPLYYATMYLTDRMIFGYYR